MARAPLVACLLLSTLTPWAGGLEAQSLRPFSTTRQFHGEVRLDAKIEFAGGTLTVGAGAPANLYSMQVTFDPARARLINHWDGTRNAVTLGLANLEEGSLGVRGTSQPQSASIFFSPQADLGLSLSIGAARTSVDLGGLRLASLTLETGASETEIRFSRRNAIRCTTADFRAGAAALTVVGLGNSQCDRVTFEGGMGSVVLDYSGAWNGDSELQATQAVGSLTLRLPREVGVTITTERFLASFESAGFSRQGNRYTSSNNATAARHLEVVLTTSLGGVTVEWLD